MTSGSNTGWQCPLCKTVYAPSVTKCDCAKDNTLPVTFKCIPYNPLTGHSTIPPYTTAYRWSGYYDTVLGKYIND